MATALDQVNTAFKPTTDAQRAALASVNKSFAITPDALAPTKPIQLPQAPTGADYSGTVAGGNALVAGNMAAFPQATGGDDPTALFEKFFGSQTPPPSAAGAYDQIYNQSAAGQQNQANQNQYNADFGALRGSQANLAAIQAQLQGISSQSQAAQLAAEGQAAPQFIISGDQQRIARQYAIQALPLQAQAMAAQANIAAKQGNAELSQRIMEQSQSHLQQVFSLHMEDAKAQHQYQSDLRKSVFDFANAEQQRRLAQHQKEDDRDFQLKMDKINYEQQVALKQLTSPYEKAQIANIYSTIGARNQAQAQAQTLAQTVNGKPSTQAQVVAKGYADRAAEADTVISGFGGKFAGASSYFGQILPNVFKSSNRQQYEQAQRNFVNAVLRPESGATITDVEFNNAKKQYFPQPGDSNAVIAQKASNRQTKINALYAAGNSQQQAVPGSTIQDADGNTYQVGSDGETLIPL